MKLLYSARSGLRILAVMGAAIFMAGFGSTNARANGWQFQDGFEGYLPGHYPYTWWAVGPAAGGLHVPRLPARSGPSTCYMYAYAGGWVSIRETVNLTPYFPWRTLNTAAAVYARPISGLNAKVTVEVIDPSTWTYIAIKTVMLKNSFTWQLVVTDAFVPHRQDVVVRVSVGSDAGLVEVDLDDITVQAQYY